MFRIDLERRHFLSKAQGYPDCTLPQARRLITGSDLWELDYVLMLFHPGFVQRDNCPFDILYRLLTLRKFRARE